jgi:hypothetical protein
METITITATLPEEFHVVKSEDYWVLWCNGEECIRSKSLDNLLTHIPGCQRKIDMKFKVAGATNA